MAVMLEDELFDDIDVPEDVEDDAEFDEQLEQVIQREHSKFIQQQAEYYQQLQANRSWKALPLASPGPAIQLQRAEQQEEEAQLRASGSFVADEPVDRVEYSPPPRPADLPPSLRHLLPPDPSQLPAEPAAELAEDDAEDAAAYADAAYAADAADGAGYAQHTIAPYSELSEGIVEGDDPAVAASQPTYAAAGADGGWMEPDAVDQAEPEPSNGEGLPDDMMPSPDAGNEGEHQAHEGADNAQLESSMAAITAEGTADAAYGQPSGVYEDQQEDAEEQQQWQQDAEEQQLQQEEVGEEQEDQYQQEEAAEEQAAGAHTQQQQQQQQELEQVGEEGGNADIQRSDCAEVMGVAAEQAPLSHPLRTITAMAAESSAVDAEDQQQLGPPAAAAAAAASEEQPEPETEAVAPIGEVQPSELAATHTEVSAAAEGSAWESEAEAHPPSDIQAEAHGDSSAAAEGSAAFAASASSPSVGIAEGAAVEAAPSKEHSTAHEEGTTAHSTASLHNEASKGSAGAKRHSVASSSRRGSRASAAGAAAAARASAGGRLHSQELSSSHMPHVLHADTSAAVASTMEHLLQDFSTAGSSSSVAGSHRPAAGASAATSKMASKEPSMAVAGELAALHADGSVAVAGAIHDLLQDFSGASAAVSTAAVPGARRSVGGHPFSQESSMPHMQDGSSTATTAAVPGSRRSVGGHRMSQEGSMPHMQDGHLHADTSAAVAAAMSELLGDFSSASVNQLAAAAAARRSVGGRHASQDGHAGHGPIPLHADTSAAVAGALSELLGDFSTGVSVQASNSAASAGLAQASGLPSSGSAGSLKPGEQSHAAEDEQQAGDSAGFEAEGVTAASADIGDLVAADASVEHTRSTPQLGESDAAASEAEAAAAVAAPEVLWQHQLPEQFSEQHEGVADSTQYQQYEQETLVAHVSESPEPAWGPSEPSQASSSTPGPAEYHQPAAATEERRSTTPSAARGEGSCSSSNSWRSPPQHPYAAYERPATAVARSRAARRPTSAYAGAGHSSTGGTYGAGSSMGGSHMSGGHMGSHGAGRPISSSYASTAAAAPQATRRYGTAPGPRPLSAGSYRPKTAPPAAAHLSGGGRGTLEGRTNWDNYQKPVYGWSTYHPLDTLNRPSTAGSCTAAYSSGRASPPVAPLTVTLGPGVASRGLKTYMSDVVLKVKQANRYCQMLGLPWRYSLDAPGTAVLRNQMRVILTVDESASPAGWEGSGSGSGSGNLQQGSDFWSADLEEQESSQQQQQQHRQGAGSQPASLAAAGPSTTQSATAEYTEDYEQDSYTPPETSGNSDSSPQIGRAVAAPGLVQSSELSRGVNSERAASAQGMGTRPRSPGKRYTLSLTLFYQRYDQLLAQVHQHQQMQLRATCWSAEPTPPVDHQPHPQHLSQLQQQQQQQQYHSQRQLQQKQASPWAGACDWQQDECSEQFDAPAEEQIPAYRPGTAHQ